MTNDLWFRRFHPRPDAALRLVCLPHAGGSASYYFPLSRALSPVADVLTVQYPGRQDRRAEPLLETVELLADGVFDALGPWLDRPVALFGHSLGASVAFEVACRMERATTSVAAMFASGRRAPSRRRDEHVHLGSDDGLLTEMAALSGTDESVLQDEEIVRMVLPVIRADYRAAETYRSTSGTVLSCPVHVHVGDADPRVTVEEARAWEVHTTGGCSLTVHPGGHFYLNDHRTALAEAVSAALAPAVGLPVGGRWS